MKPLPLLLALTCLASLPAADKKPAVPVANQDKVVVLEPLRINESPIIAFAIDVTVYADPATKKVSRIFIAKVLPETDAARAGLQPGDEIVKLDGTPVKEMDATLTPGSPLGRSFLNRDPGDLLSLEVITHRTQQIVLQAQRGLPGYP